ncbi:hypothetical protein GOV08_04935 [Candidatus Woesearchaeota archaeon]|nr:hypothetical protein [Candidatus Woesearchaeota archaeon]
MRRIDTDVLNSMIKGFRSVCDTCGSVHLPDDEGLRCDCDGTYIIQY